MNLSLEEVRKRTDSYSLDAEEFGKILFVASAAVFVVSAHSTLQLREASNDISSLNSDLDQLRGVMESQEFQQSLEAIQSTEGTAVGQRFSTAADAFEQISGNLNRTEELDSEVGQTYETYRWVTLASVLGAVAGAIIFLGSRH